MQTIHWKQGESLPFLQTILTDATGAALPLTGLSVAASLRDRLGRERWTADAKVLDPATGSIEVDWPTTFPLAVGEYWLDFPVTYPDGRVLRVPSGNNAIHFLVWP